MRSIQSNNRSQFLKKICSIYPCIFIQRKNIDVYISSLKAKLTAAYYSLDTTDIKPRAEASDFKRFVDSYSRFYNNCYSLIMSSHKNATIINYEDWAAEQDDEQLEKIKFYLQIELNFLNYQKKNLLILPI